ncbi:Spermidine synthase [Leucoagaricus sp. SymC.cos]|nr:Spermidine synthase [Leucoagaricus sp. SymC.cos]
MLSSVAAPILNTAHVAVTALLPISLVLLAHQRILNPLYGSYPTLYSLDTVISVAIIASVLKPFTLKRRWNWLAAALLLTTAPNSSYWVAVWAARGRRPVLGAGLTHVVIVAPLVFIFTNFVAEKVWPRITLLNGVSESQILLMLAGLSFCAFIVHLDFSSGATKSKKRGNDLASKSSLSSTQIKASLLAAFGALWYIISPSFANPILPHPLSETFTHRSGRLQIHAAVQSVTGLVVVGDTLPSPHGDDDSMHSARYLRVDHSLLGGVWMRDRAITLEHEPFVVDSYGAKLGDTVYSTFVLQEAARLVDSTKVGKTENWKSALTIGLGTGFSTSAFIRHGLNTTIVEIDPAVYNAARTWFGLPDPGVGNVFLEDARQFVERRAKEMQTATETNLFDIVVHDCFSGGGVPEHIFTTEFWSSLKQIMDTEGILVANFAGVANSDSSKMILHTLERNFRQCRAFHDWMSTLDEDKYNEEFINIVFFCTDSEAPMTFRKPKRSDYLGSHLRKHIFKSLDTREVSLDIIRERDSAKIEKYILTDKHNPLGDLQRKQGLHHWEVMRQVLNDVHWETF